MEREGSFRTFLRDCFFCASFRELLNYWLGIFFSAKKFYLSKLIGLRFRYSLNKMRGCDFSHNTKKGKGLRLPQPIGVVIGDGVEADDHVAIFQNVAVGSHGKAGSEKSFHNIGTGVKVYVGAKINGGLTIGEDAVVAANTVVSRDVNPGNVIGRIPAKVLEMALLLEAR